MSNNEWCKNGGRATVNRTVVTQLQGSFASILMTWSGSVSLFEVLVDHAFDLFEANIGPQTAHLPQLACAKGCSSCCSLRVTATAPEIFLLAQYVRRIEAGPAGATIGLTRQIALADRATQGLGEAERMALRRPCPFIVRGVCVVHPVRPLACRGHASFDRRACVRAVAGRDVEVPVSAPHIALRGLVQHALRSALGQAGLASGLYELNHGLALALDGNTRVHEWLAGTDSLAPARVEPDMARPIPRAALEPIGQRCPVLTAPAPAMASGSTRPW
jgi:Fe-S-cluster containining protein